MWARLGLFLCPCLVLSSARILSPSGSNQVSGYRLEDPSFTEYALSPHLVPPPYPAPTLYEPLPSEREGALYDQLQQEPELQSLEQEQQEQEQEQEPDPYWTWYVPQPTQYEAVSTPEELEDPYMTWYLPQEGNTPYLPQITGDTPYLLAQEEGAAPPLSVPEDMPVLGGAGLYPPEFRGQYAPQFPYSLQMPDQEQEQNQVQEQGEQEEQEEQEYDELPTLGEGNRYVGPFEDGVNMFQLVQE